MKLIGEQASTWPCCPSAATIRWGRRSPARRAVIQPAAVLPVHYNTFPVIQVDVAGWARRVHTEPPAKSSSSIRAAATPSSPAIARSTGGASPTRSRCLITGEDRLADQGACIKPKSISRGRTQRAQRENQVLMVFLDVFRALYGRFFLNLAFLRVFSWLRGGSDCFSRRWPS
jgi:hypothetical protein